MNKLSLLAKLENNVGTIFKNDPNPIPAFRPAKKKKLQNFYTKNLVILIDD